MNSVTKRIRKTCIMRVARATAPLLAVAAILLAIPQVAQSRTPIVLAAASLTQPLTLILDVFEKETGIHVVPVFAASGTLARQVHQGAPALIFISASVEWMDWLDKDRLMASDTRINLVSNCLVLIQPQGRSEKFSLQEAVADPSLENRIAIGNPSFVPAGTYAQQALQNMGLWQALAPKLARLPSVRHVLAFVQRGEAAGIVYSSDAEMAGNVDVTQMIDPRNHPPIVYPFAIIADNDTPLARRLHVFLQSPESTAILLRHGFQSPGTSCSS